MRILIVEDSPGDARLVEEMLRDEMETASLAFECQSSMASALHRLREDDFDIVLLDLGLPDAQGLDAINMARLGAPFVPIIVLTGMDDEIRALRTLQLGAQDYLVKGDFSAALLARAIRYAIERYQVQSLLRTTVLELEGRTEEMESFTYSVSHDLKEPLRSLEAFSRFLLEDYAAVLDDKGKEYLNLLANASARLKDMIESLLVLSQLGQKAHELDKVDVSKVTSEIVAANEFTMVQKHATVTIEADLPPVLADALRVEQVFANLISNGLKFNRNQQPHVAIGLAQVSEDSATFFVRDNGIGIEPAYHERIFGVFQRLHVREDYEGNGAGLAIVKRATVAMGGTVSLESSLGLGCTFYITLPRWQLGTEFARPAGMNV